MSARVWSWASEKGGVGKTTNVINVGCQLTRMGKDVLLVDADPHKSVASWSAMAGDKPNLPAVVELTGSLKNDIPKLRRRFNYILIDCEGTLNTTSMDALKVSDMMVVPYTPSALDVWGNHSLIELIQARQEVTDGKPQAVTILNMVDKRSRFHNEILETLSDYNMPVLKSRTSRLKAYVETMVEGDTVTALGEDNKATFEIKMLTKELLEFDKW